MLLQLGSFLRFGMGMGLHCHTRISVNDTGRLEECGVSSTDLGLPAPFFRATPHNLARSPSLDFWLNSKFGKRRNTVCTRKGYAASVSQLTLATAAQYFSFFKLKKWGKKTAAARRHNCAVLPYKQGGTKEYSDRF